MKELQEFVIGLVGAGAGTGIAISLYFLAKYLEFFSKKRLEFHKQTVVEKAKLRAFLALPRIAAYRELWKKMEPFSPTNATPPSDQQRATFDAELQKWYYENGNGMFLSLDAQRAYLLARAVLRRERIKKTNGGDALIDLADAFSALRTQMKVDLAIYGPAQKKIEADPTRTRPTVNLDEILLGEKPGNR